MINFLAPTDQLGLVPTSAINKNPQLKNLTFISYHRNEQERDLFQNKKYAFQHYPEKYHELEGVLCLKGNISSDKARLSIISTLILERFVHIIRYDPAKPPIDDYKALKMEEAHSRTQADFKGAKLKNRDEYYSYLIEGLRDERELHLPIISAWQSKEVFNDTIFVCYHENIDGEMYGRLYIPRSPIMQLDGQTQTAALFKVSTNSEAVDLGALKNLRATIEIELNVDAISAAQGFADKNGRGTKKNKNLVISMDSSSPLSKLRALNVPGTIFEDRISTGKDGAIKESSTTHIVDLSTMEQMIIIALTGNITAKPEIFKHHHISTLSPYVRKMLKMFDSLASYYPEKTDTKNDDPYRKKYTLGWPFMLKAIAMSFYHAHEDELKYIILSFGAKPERGDTSLEQAFLDAIQHKRETVLVKKSFNITYDDLLHRLRNINWKKHTIHWIAITGFAVDKNGAKNKLILKSEGKQEVVKGSNTNNAVTISRAANKISGDSWEDLTRNIFEPL